MATLILQELDDELVRRLEERAAAHGRSAEAEHRAILEAALRPGPTGRDLWNRLSQGEPMELDLDRSAATATPRPPKPE